VAAFEGTGKTRFLMDLARRCWHGLDWPDGQRPTFPPHTPSLWLCSDGQQAELLDLMSAFDLPDEAVYFPTSPDEPWGGTSLDDQEMVKPGGTLETAIATIKPGLTFIDSLSNATRRDLCGQDQVSALKGPLAGICQAQKASIVLSLHLSKEGEVLGVRTKGITRVLSYLECPDKDNYQRLRLSVEKSFAAKPATLGVTMNAEGNEYDTDPPPKASRNKGGRPAAKVDKARMFIVESLTQNNDERATTLRDRWVEQGEKESTFWNARDALRESGDVIQDGKPYILHLVKITD
jgi:hypothetical protein